MQCAFESCTARNGILDGYCRTHRKRGVGNKSPASTSTTTSTSSAVHPDLQAWMERMETKMDNMLSTLQFEVTQLNNQVDELKTENSELKTEIKNIKVRQNVQFFAADAHNQHGRHENFRIYNIPEVAEGATENCFDVAVRVGQQMGIEVKADDFQRCHRLGNRFDKNGKPRSNPRAIICRARWYKTKQSFMKKENRQKLRADTRGKTIEERKEILSKTTFVAEDLSPFRSQMLRYIKEWNKTSNKFDAIGTNYGKICCKLTGKTEWKKISSTDDFFDADIPYDDNFIKEFSDQIFIST